MPRHTLHPLCISTVGCPPTTVGDCRAAPLFGCYFGRASVGTTTSTWVLVMGRISGWVIGRASVVGVADAGINEMSE